MEFDGKTISHTVGSTSRMSGSTINQQYKEEFKSFKTSDLSMSVEREAKRLGVDEKYDPTLNNPSIEAP